MRDFTDIIEAIFAAFFALATFLAAPYQDGAIASGNSSAPEWDGGNVAPGNEPAPEPIIISPEFDGVVAAAPPARAPASPRSRTAPIVVEEAFEAPMPEAMIIEDPSIATFGDEAEDDGYSHVTLFFATNRARVAGTRPDDLTEQFENENAAEVTYGIAEVSIPDTHVEGQLETQNRFVAWVLPPNPKKHVILQDMVPLSRDQVMSFVDFVLQSENAIMMYVHGFNTPMELAARRSGQLTFDLGWNGPSFFFSWPSQGNPAAYTIDANMAQRSERALVEVLQELGDTGAEKIVIIAHSMGTQLLTQSLLRLDQATRDRISTIVLAAPDIDVDVFENDILPVFREMEDTKVTLYASSEDAALKMSHTVNGFTRIGDTVNGVRPLEPVQVVDATGAESDFFGHTYFGDNATIVDDIKTLIRDGLDPMQRPTLAGVPEPDGPTWKIVLPAE